MSGFCCTDNLFPLKVGFDSAGYYIAVVPGRLHPVMKCFVPRNCYLIYQILHRKKMSILVGVPEKTFTLFFDPIFFSIKAAKFIQLDFDEARQIWKTMTGSNECIVNPVVVSSVPHKRFKLEISFPHCIFYT